MEYILKDLNPNLVFKYFEDISQIPRGSKNEKAISDYLKAFGESLGLETMQDNALNVIIKKPATKGYENAPGVILQGHMDMVCEKNKDTVHDFENDPIELQIKDGFIHANGTTLGADNGIAVAMGMAVLASNDISHPALELLVTTDEEAGMSGAMALDASVLNGKYILNLDSEEEGYLLVSCAGGVTVTTTLDVDYTDVDPSNECLLIEITGLFGGHSGMDVIKQRGNANVLMGRILHNLNSNFNICSISGGSKNNAIPREAECIIAVESSNTSKVIESIKQMEEIFKNEFSTSDPGIVVKVSSVDREPKCFDNASTSKVVTELSLIPNGIQTMSMDIPGLVESSTNIGVLRTTDSTVTFECLSRSSVTSLKQEIVNKMEILANTLNGKVELASDYPAWEYSKGSKLEDICANVYEDLRGEKPIVMALHAGLECGLLLDKMPHAEAISLGPDMFDVHTPSEKLNIQSTANTWEYLLKILEAIK